MQDGSPLAVAHQSIADGVAALRAASDSRADANTRIEALAVCEQLTRQLEQLSIELTAGLDRDGVFTDRGYHRAAHAVADLLGWDLGVANRRVRVAEQVCERVSLDGQVLPARLTDTAVVFAAGEVSLRHVEVIADALACSAAGRLAPQVWAGAEQQLAARAREYRPRELAGFARDLITTLDQDGPEPDHGDEAQVNELYLATRPGGAGGRDHRSVRRTQLRRATHRPRRTVHTDRGGPAIAGRTPRRRPGRTVPPTPGRRRPADGRRAAPTPDGDRAAGRAGNPGPHRDARPRRPAHHRAAADAGL